MMRKISNFPYFQNLKHRGAAMILALASLLLLLLIPTHPLGEENGRGIAEMDDTDAATIKIYSFVSRRGGFDKGLAWSIADVILEESQKHSLDPLLVLAVIEVESRFRPRAVSAQGARGLMQIRPFVATALAGAADIENWTGKESLDNPILNIRLGVLYLSQLKQNFKDLKLALTAYNLGPTEVRSRLGEREPIPFGYARRVLSIHRIYQSQDSRAQKIPSAKGETQAFNL